MTKAPASTDPNKTKAANAPRTPTVKAPAPKPASESVKEAETKVEASVSKTATDVGKKVDDVGRKAETLLEDTGRKVDSATENLLSSLGLKDFPKDPTTDAEKRRTMLTTYALYAASVFTFGLTAVFAYLVYVRKFKNTLGGVWTSHMVWLERTFLFSAGATVIGILLYGWFGWLIPLAALIYLLYRTIKGYLRYDESKAIEAPQAYY